MSAEAEDKIVRAGSSVSFAHLTPEQRLLALEPWAGEVAAKLLVRMNDGESWMSMSGLDALGPGLQSLDLCRRFEACALVFAAPGKFYVRFTPTLWSWCRTAEAFAKHCAKAAPYTQKATP